MASQIGNQDFVVGLLQQFQQEAYKYDFFQFLRLIECVYPDKPKIGYSVKPSGDPIRLGQKPSMQFSPSTIAAFDSENHDIATLKVFFFGLFGPNGPLPLHLTEFTRNRVQISNDPTFAEFADLFHHRLLSLFYRAWSDKEPTVQLDRPESDRFSFYVGSFLGMAEPSQRHRDSISDHTKLHFAAHLGCQTKHVEGLEAILQAYFRVPIVIKEFVGEWLKIPEDSLCYLYSDRETAQLGVSATIGERSWQCMHKFRIVAGPLNLKQFEQLLPNGNCLKAFSNLIDNYVGYQFQWDLNLVLLKQEVPVAKLGQYSKLGWNSWLAAQHRSQDASDVYINMRMNG